MVSLVLKIHTETALQQNAVMSQLILRGWTIKLKIQSDENQLTERSCGVTQQSSTTQSIKQQ